MSEEEVLRTDSEVLGRNPTHRANSRRLEEEVLIRYYRARSFVIMISHVSAPQTAVIGRHSVM